MSGANSLTGGDHKHRSSTAVPTCGANQLVSAGWTAHGRISPASRNNACRSYSPTDPEERGSRAIWKDKSTGPTLLSERASWRTHSPTLFVLGFGHMTNQHSRWARLGSTLLLDCTPWFRVFADDVQLPGGRQV